MSLAAVGCIRDVEGRFIDGRQEHVRQRNRRLARNDLLRNGATAASSIAVITPRP
jgi:hypothetical protein